MRKRNNEPPDSPSSDGERAIHNKSLLIVERLGRKMNDLHTNMGNQLKLLNAKMILLGTKVDKIQRCFLYVLMINAYIQGTPPKCAFYPSVVTDETRPSPSVAASVVLPQNTEEDFYKI